MEPKQIIIDKDVFGGIKTDDLRDFAKNHFLVLPEVLLYECLTTQKNQENLLDRFRQVLLAGACICPNIKSIINKEAKELSPYGPLVNLRNTQEIRSAYMQKDGISYDLSAMSEYLDGNTSKLLNATQGFHEEFASKHPDILTAIRKLDNSKTIKAERFICWAQLVDLQDVHRLAEANLRGITETPEKYCLSDEWVSWHFLRVTFIIILEYCFLKHNGASIGEDRAAHDCRDAEYVYLLSRVDGLLTRDNDCRLLAKAAFPEKDVFSDIDQVSKEYICH